MEKYYHLVSQAFQNRLAQIKQFIRNHNPTIGLLTEEIIRQFLKDHLPKSACVEQGFIMKPNGEISKQCDILIYDSFNYAPYYRINDVVIIPSHAVIAIIEVKTTMTKQIFHETITYFRNISEFKFDNSANTYLFIFNSPKLSNYANYLRNFKHPGDYQQFDHDTFQFLPDEITGLNDSFHLKKADVNYNSDMIGYDSWFYADSEGTEISALQNFFISVHEKVQYYQTTLGKASKKVQSPRLSEELNLVSISAIELFSS